jgi:hypothetical protein
MFGPDQASGLQKQQFCSDQPKKNAILPILPKTAYTNPAKKSRSSASTQKLTQNVRTKSGIGPFFPKFVLWVQP